MSESKKRFDRAYVRSLAEQHAAELRDVALEGGNPHQRALDQGDALNELVIDWPEEDQAKFFQTYAEEIAACSSYDSDQAHAASLQRTQDAHSAGMDAWWIVVVGIMVAIFLLLAAIN